MTSDESRSPSKVVLDLGTATVLPGQTSSLSGAVDVSFNAELIRLSELPDRANVIFSLWHNDEPFTTRLLLRETWSGQISPTTPAPLLRSG